MFCGCPLKDIANAKPNSRCCPICLGMPGSKPRVNKAVVEAGIKIALAFGCKINPEIFFSRKTYLYPDMSKNFQISQYEIPIGFGGKLEIQDGEGKSKTITIKRAHIEEDPAKIEHVGKNIISARYTLIDYNRSGIPLCEIVTEPNMSSAKEARIFLQRLLGIVEYLGVYKLGDLSLKTDVNVSVDGGKRVEVKNVTGFKEVEDVVKYEIQRQKDVIKKGGKVERETRAWDENSRVTRSLRKKEFEEDYGYIFEPDLTMIELTDEWIENLRKTLPELPHEKYDRYMKDFGISSEQAKSMTSDLEIAQFYDKIVKHIDPKFAATWINILKKTLFFNDITLKETKLSKSAFNKLLKLIDEKKVTDRGAEMILREIISKPENFDDLVDKYSAVDIKNVEKVVDEVLKDNENAVEEYKKGIKKSLDFLVGQVIKKVGKRIDVKELKSLLKSKIK
jgi:aspartyl-tRNA(Asn)/glutamyl-tRNA(Gln) amidotransferase subunit B